MPSSKGILERIGSRVDVPEPSYERFVRRRERIQRNRRIGGGIVGIGLAVALIAVLGIVSAERADRPAIAPDPLPTNGWLVYLNGSEGANSAGLYVAREGVSPRRIVASFAGRHHQCPSFSPDGTMLAYTEFDRPYIEVDRPRTVSLVVTLIDRSGTPIGAEQRITTTMMDGNLCARWGPDSRRLLYRDGAGLWIATLDGSLTTELFRDGEDSASFSGVWSPDGSTIADWVGSGVLLLPSDGSVPSRHIPVDLGDGASLTWSPDGSDIAVGQGGRNPGLVVIDVDEGIARSLDTGVPPVGGAPTWSPDGRSIAFVVDYGDKEGRIALVDPDSGDVVLLPPVVVPEVSERPLSIWEVAWSPDGRRLLTIGSSGDGYAVITIDADGASPPVAVSRESWGFYRTAMSDVDWQAVYP